MRAALVALVALAGCAPLLPPASYTNPVLDRDFPDPAVLRAPDGLYYAYATQGGAAGAIVAARSPKTPPTGFLPSKRDPENTSFDPAPSSGLRS